MNNNILIIILICLLCQNVLLLNSNNKKINVLDLKKINKPLKESDTSSVFSRVCWKILSTVDFLGKKSLDIYKKCINRYDLLPISNPLVLKEKPYCLTNLNEYFCNNFIYEPKKGFCGTKGCDSQESINFILSTLKGCLNSKHSGLTESYNCPSLDHDSFKIKNKVDFCKYSMKRELYPDKYQDKKILKISIPDNLLHNCERIVEIYNSCIKAHGLIFPDSNYEECLNPKNLLYVCSEEEKFHFEKEKEICSNFVLPSIAWSNIKDNVFHKTPAFFCDSYENKILHNYNIRIEELSIENKRMISKIDKFSKFVIISQQLLKRIQLIEGKVKKLSQSWKKFHGLFIKKYMTKSKIPSGSIIKFKRIIRNLNNLNHYSDQLIRSTRKRKFILMKFEQLNRRFDAMFLQSNKYSTRLTERIDELYEIINPHPSTNGLRPIHKETNLVNYQYATNETNINQNIFVVARMNLKSYFKFITVLLNKFLKKYQKKVARARIQLRFNSISKKYIQDQRSSLLKIVSSQ